MISLNMGLRYIFSKQATLYKNKFGVTALRIKNILGSLGTKNFKLFYTKFSKYFITSWK